MNNHIKNKVVALGDTQFTFAVYIANQPKMPEYESLKHIMPLQLGEIDSIGKACGNGWRKVFNVYAKLLYALDKNHFHFSELAPTWQQYRDQFLLQKNSTTALIFTPPCLNNIESSYVENSYLDNREIENKLIECSHVENTNAEKSKVRIHKIKNNTVHIICGRTYAKKMINDGQLSIDLLWLDEEFAINFEHAVIVCPYFDYRQLSNQKIQRLSSLLSALVTGSDEDVIATAKGE